MKLSNHLSQILSNTLPVGINNQSNIDKWVEKTLKDIPIGSRILDAGAGELRCKKFCLHLDYVSQDFAKYDGIGDGKGLQSDKWDQTKIDIISDIANIPENDYSFDVVMCIGVFEHLPEPIKAIQEFSRLLKPDGHLIITAPFCSLTHLAPFHFYSGFNKYFFEEHLSKNGFKILELVENGNYFEYLAQEIRRLPSIGKRYANKKITIIDYFAIYLLLKLLYGCSRLDKGSSELLNFGFNIHAIKKRL